MDNLHYIYFIAFPVIGFLLGWFIFSFLNQKKLHKLKEKEHSLLSDKKGLNDKIDFIIDEKSKLENEIDIFFKKNEEMINLLAVSKTENENLKEKLNTQKSELEDLQKRFTLEFENLANKILKKNTEEFTTTNRKNMSEILTPLQEKISGFEKKVNEAYDKELRDKISLREEVKKLYTLNQQLSTEATNLTNALKGDVKTLGNWGEVILERILERSGLRLGQEYIKQESFSNESGKRFQPDVIVNLPENKKVIIDAKVSLYAYENYASTNSEDERKRYLKEHLISIKNHIKNLSEKNYQNIFDIQSLDFVLLFIPIEPAFSLAVYEEQSLFSKAFDKNIILVSPSTLLATLRTIANIWKMEYQNKNALEIAQQAGKLYDKFVGFSDDLIAIGKKMDDSKKSYESAMNKLLDGRGNLVRSVEKIKQLGAKTSKAISQNLIDRSLED